MARLYIVLFLALSSILSFSCKSGGDGPGQPTAAELAAQGWQSYGTKSYQDAHGKFTQAISLDANFVDGYNGAGWTSAKLSQPAAAIASFNAGLTRDTANLEIKAGLAFAFNAQRNYSQSILFAILVLQANPAWSFSHDQTVSAADVHLLLAEDYFATADYAASLAEVIRLDSSFPPPDVGTVVGQQALAQEIERLRPLV